VPVIVGGTAIAVAITLVVLSVALNPAGESVTAIVNPVVTVLPGAT
jgi:hypothetical protein